jgi:hypothetical protein
MSNQRIPFSIESLKEINPEGMLAEYFIKPAIALLEDYRLVPYPLDITCSQIDSDLLNGSDTLQVEINWLKETFPDSKILLNTIQREVIIENTAVAIAFLLTTEVVGCTIDEVTLRGDRADYFMNGRDLMLEISGTGALKQCATRHKQKSEQLLENPYGKPGYVVVCCFSTQEGFFSYHEGQDEGDGNHG